jgi:hypothetical protein
METKESRSPRAVLALLASAGESALAELEAAVKLVKLDLREKILLLAFV